MKEEKYTCPMHPKVVMDAPGLCPECGMNLIPEKKKVSRERHGHNHGREGHSTNIFKTRFWVSLVLSLPVVAYSDIVQSLLRYEAPKFPGSEYLSFVLSSVIFFYGGLIFITSAYRELKAKLPGMMTLIALAISTAYLYSVAVTFLGGGEPLYWELATLITVMLLGHWMEMRAVTGAKGALKELSKLLPDTAEVIIGSGTKIIPLSELKIGDVMLVKPGGKIPADGAVLSGESDVDESIITGESKPVRKKAGDAVIAGTILGDGSLKVKVTKIGDDTFLAGVMRLVREAEASKSRLQVLSDRAAYYLTIIAVVVGGITLITWLTLSDPAFAVSRMVAVLVVACPHALGLAIPLVASISTTKAAENGFLVKRRLALEAARNVTLVLFDKTGTLTKGEFGITRVSSEETLVLAAAVDVHSEHPIARAIVREARARGLVVPDAKNYRRIAGVGGEAEVEGQKVFVGHRGGADIQVEADGRKIGSILVADVVRPEAKEAVTALKKLGIKVAMITGDSEDVAREVSAELGIDEYFARVLPGEKLEKVKYLQSEGGKVMMVGDGINDAPALTQADVGIAIGAGTNVAIESAGIILVKNDPRDIPKIIKLSRLTYNKMIQNLFWATGYNVVAIPLAAGALAFKGIFLEPALAGFLMSMSTVIVAVNAVFLKKRKL
ncbi:MAG: copper-translocating P-type ATPase [Candidatus Jorgensenbacteria bacterium]